MLTIIVPLQEGENKIYSLLKQCDEYNLQNVEFILVFAESASKNIQDSFKDYSRLNLKIVRYGNSRASQMNFGVQVASSDHLWFLHADSSIEADAAVKVNNALTNDENAVFYFKLKFEKSECKLMIFNSIGANLRSAIFKAPFGDQGFCMNKKVFSKVGGFPVYAKYGEDNLFILKAKNLRIPIRNLNSFITTSARKYEDNGWCRITLLHQFLWIKQNLATRTR